MAGMSLRCLKVLSPFWTTLLRCCDSSPTHNRSGLCSIRAITMAATSSMDSVWTRKSMRRFSSSLAWRHMRFGWLPNQGHGQLVVTLPLLVLSLHRPLVLSSRQLVVACVASRRATLSLSWLVVASSSLVVLSLHRPLVLLSCSAQRRQGDAGRQAARRRQRAAQ